MLTNVICCPCSQIELVAAIADKDTIAAQAAVVDEMGCGTDGRLNTLKANPPRAPCADN